MVKKVFVFLFCLGVSLYAYDFEACEKKSSSFLEKVGNTYGVAIKALNKERAVLFVYSPRVKPKGYKILKHDPFVGMYLLESKRKLEPIALRTISKDIIEDEMASVTPYNSVSGKIATRMQSPIDFATLNVPTFNNSVISTVCEHIYGIGIGGNAFIEKDYLERFVNSDAVYYGDIGVRVELNPYGEVGVKVIDPFFKNNPFKYNDVILAINGEKISNLASFHRIVFDLERNSVALVEIKRNGEILEVPVSVDKRRGGMLLKEDFLGRVGIAIDDDFTITHIDSDAKDGFERLRVGDKVLRINQKTTPKGYNAIIHLLGEYPDETQRWLISRDDFQFFIDVNVKGKKVENSSLTEGLLSETTRFAL